MQTEILKFLYGIKLEVHLVQVNLWVTEVVTFDFSV